MSLIAGIDEAGYGPMLGPLVVSSAVFRVNGKAEDACLWRILKPAVWSTRRGRGEKLVVADSKKLYSGTRDLGALEETVLAFMAARGQSVKSFRDLLDQISIPGPTVLDGHAWYQGADVQLPVRVAREVLPERARKLARTLESCGVTFEGFRTFPLAEGRYNEELRISGSKSCVLWTMVSCLIREAHRLAGDDPTFAFVDKQGSRRFYAALVGESLRVPLVATRRETAEISSYAVHGARPLEITFLEKGEEKSFSVALASICSKYVRELFMYLLNRYWSSRVPGLRPTAGYVRDARRYLAEIRSACREDGTDMPLVVRER